MNNESIEFTIMDKYSFSLLPGNVNDVGNNALSYYQYLNDSRLRHQTGKNIQCVMWCVGDTPKGLKIEEPFGGVGVFSMALNKMLEPSYHRIIEIDEQCYNQLVYSLKDCMNTEIIHGDSHDLMGKVPVDISVADLPYFGIRRYLIGDWTREIHRTLNHNPMRMLITDGCRFNYHNHWKRYKDKYDSKITNNPESYVYMMSDKFYEDTGYSVTRCAYHGACFYYMLEKTIPIDIEFKYFGSGTGENGLRLSNSSPIEKFL